MSYSKNFLVILAIVFLSGCSENHVISDKNYLATVDKAFAQRQNLAINRKKELFDVLNTNLSVQQSEALKFLLAYMPLSDLADYNSGFFLANINKSLQSKSDTRWGESIPDEIFLHYVLPCRINNENLDSFRIKYYDEIVNRVKDMDIMSAALEVNHWCHEKVTYQPADSRTSAPVSTILSARGRCGEESTFTVAALRTAGIPARQVYTPRWAHSDDNHAWVEVWCDGTWHYMGACEPEAVVDKGWFTEPARRAMLVNTKSFGAGSGNENYINVHNNFTEVNSLSRYAVVKQLFVKVLDTKNKPVKDAFIEFQLYNYSEFYPLAVIPSDDNGISSFETGLGDLLIWARKNNDFAFCKISVAETDTLTLVLKNINPVDTIINYDLNVPVIRTPYPPIPEELTLQNNKRVEQENSIRQKYIDSWIKPGEAAAFALKINEDTTVIKDIIARSMGNYKTIVSFLSDSPDSLRHRAVSLLGIITDKDLRDITEPVLSDHLSYSKKTSAVDEDIFLHYVLNPRVANEIVVAWRKYFIDKLSENVKSNALSNPESLVDYINTNIKIADDENYYKTPITPIGISELRVSDSKSRDIYFVALCRSLGIASRLEPGSNVPQYYNDSSWHDVYFAGLKKASDSKGFLKFVSANEKPEPAYYYNFTIARFENGRYNTLEYDENLHLSDFKDGLPLAPGFYMLVTGNRLNNGKILSSLSFFELKENEHKTININIRKNISVPEIFGKVDLAKLSELLDGNENKSMLKKGAVLLWIEPEKEPTKHIFNDLPLMKNELDKWGGCFLFFSAKKTESEKTRINGIPTNSFFLNDDNFSLLKEVSQAGTIAGIHLPYIILVDSTGNIVFRSEGYRIGIGEQIIKSL